MTELTSEAKKLAALYGVCAHRERLAVEIDALTEQRVSAARRSWVHEDAKVMRPFEEEAAAILAECERGFDGDEPHKIEVIARALRQRVAAAVQGERERIAEAVRNSARATLDDLADEILKSADRPAPEGAALATKLLERLPTGGSAGGVGVQQDGDTPRCSTPSQEDTGSVSGGRWRKKPVVIEAIQWTGDNREEVFAWLRPWERQEALVYYIGKGPEGDRLAVETLEGKTFADPGHWIIRGVKGELYPCAADIFAATYDRAEPPKDASGPGSASNTESSPTREPMTPQVERVLRQRIEQLDREADRYQREIAEIQALLEYRTQTVAAPGPTPGDVEQAIALATRWVGPNATGSLEHPTFSERTKACWNEIAAAISASRAELLAQIGEPTLHRAVAQLVAENLGYDPKLNWRGTISDKDFPQLVADICDALCDKLTEAK